VSSVYYSGDVVLIERRGEVVAVIVHPDVYKRSKNLVERSEDYDRVASGLSPRERSVLTELAQGKTESEIAILESLSVRTVEDLLSALKKKLGASTLGELGARARDLGSQV
jgi:DNA-binding CsgD family transcriptional regulator